MDKLAQLSLPERHGVAMTCIKHVRVKLELLVLKSSFGERVDEMLAASRTFRSAVLEVRQSEPLACTLQAILHIGNYCECSIGTGLCNTYMATNDSLPSGLPPMIKL